MIITILGLIALFMIIAIPHEAGHFFTARACGVKVNEFAFGMGPVIWQREDKRGTKISWRALPLGGFCAMEAETEDDENSDSPTAFTNKKAWQKILILIAGSTMNVITAFLLMIIAVSIMGIPTNTLSEVPKGEPAYVAGIRAGDEIVAVNGESTDRWEDVVLAIQDSTEGQTLNIMVERDGESKNFAPIVEKNKDGQLILGIVAGVTHNPVYTAPYGVRATWNVNKRMLSAFAELIHRGVNKDDMAGPVGIARLVNTSTGYGFASFLYLSSFICLNMAIMNLLPFPALDGGRILFVIIRKVTGRLISDKLETAMHVAGMMMLMMLFVFITMNDITKWISG